jgi:hypothetical protein
MSKQAQQWIPVNKGLPYRKSCHYLVLSQMDWSHGGVWEEGGTSENRVVAYFDCTGKFNIPYVTHWMPLPELPEGE